MIYRPDIDGLRAIAIIFVLVFHAFPSALPGGFLGVDVFFVISGYLITSIIIDSHKHGKFSLLSFYAHRIRRIFPALILVLGAAFIFGYLVLREDEMERLGKHVLGGSLFVSNLLLQTEAGYFDVSAELKPLLHLWSLGIEEQFYLVWPLFVILAFRLGRPALFITAAFSLSLVYNLRFSGPSEMFYSTPVRAWELLAGALIAQFEFKDKFSLPQWLKQASSISGACLLVFSLIVINNQLRYPGFWALVPVIGTSLLIIAGPRAHLNKVLLGASPLVAIGLISYPLYLWHWPVISYLRILFGQQVAAWIISAGLLLSLFLAWSTYKVVEKPIRVGKEIKLKNIVFIFLGSMIFMGIIGWFTYVNHGLPERLAVKGYSQYSADLDSKELAYNVDESCKALLGIIPLRNEFCKTNTKSPKAIVTGDSFAVSLNYAVQDGRVDIPTLLVAQNGCLPFGSILNHGPGDPTRMKNCNEISEHAVILARDIESITTVVIFSRNSTYLYNRIEGPENSVDAVNYRWIKSPDKSSVLDNKSALIDGYNAFFNRIRSTGKRIVLVLENPNLLGVDVAGCVRSRRFMPENSCSVSRKTLDDYELFLKEVMSELAVQNKDVTFIETTSIFCNLVECPAKSEGKLYYFDQTHLSVSGAEKVWKLILQTASLH